MSDNEGRFEVLSPEGPKRELAEARSAPLPSLDDKRIGQLWDYRFRGDEIFEHLRDELSGPYPEVAFVDYEVFGNVHGHREDDILGTLPGLLEEHGCDAVLSGIGA